MSSEPRECTRAEMAHLHALEAVSAARQSLLLAEESSKSAEARWEQSLAGDEAGLLRDGLAAEVAEERLDAALRELCHALCVAAVAAERRVNELLGDLRDLELRFRRLAS